MASTTADGDTSYEVRKAQRERDFQRRGLLAGFTYLLADGAAFKKKHLKIKIKSASASRDQPTEITENESKKCIEIPKI